MGHELRAGDVLVTRVPGSRWVLFGIKGRGYVRLRPDEAAQLAQGIWSLCGHAPEDDAAVN